MGKTEEENYEGNFYIVFHQIHIHVNHKKVRIFSCSVHIYVDDIIYITLRHRRPHRTFCLIKCERIGGWMKEAICRTHVLFITSVQAFIS